MVKTINQASKHDYLYNYPKTPPKKLQVGACCKPAASNYMCNLGPFLCVLRVLLWPYLLDCSSVPKLKHSGCQFRFHVQAKTWQPATCNGTFFIAFLWQVEFWRIARAFPGNFNPQAVALLQFRRRRRLQWDQPLQMAR